MVKNIDDNERVVLIGYFSSNKTKTWMFDVFEFFMDLAHQKNFPVNEFSFDGKDGTIISGSCRRKGKKYQEFLTWLKSNDPKEGKGIGLSHFNQNDYMIFSQFQLLLNNSIKEKGYGYVGLQLTSAAFQDSEEIYEFSKEIFKKLASIVNIKQGFIRKFDKKKAPLMYYHDSTSMASLSKAEEEEIENWVANGKQFESLVRGVYWGNLLTDGHFDKSEIRKSHICKQLEQECGSKVYQLNDELVLLCAPEDLARKDVTEKKLRKYIKAVETVLLANEVKLLSMLN